MAIFIDGLGAPETPRLRSDGSWLCVEMAPDRGGVAHIAADGSAVTRIARTGCPNGLCIDGDGVAWVAETSPPALLRVTMDGTVETFLDLSDVGQFLLPNDLCFSACGLLYMTDSGMLMADWVPGGAIRPDWATADFDGRIYEIDLARKTARAIDRGLRFANGIAFGPDGHLYANEMITGNVYRYACKAGRVLGERQLFANVLSTDWGGGFRGPDGMGFSSDGRLWCTLHGEGNVAVLSAEGDVTSRLATAGNAPTNVAFGANNEKRLYVSEHQHGRIEVFPVDAGGLRLNSGPGM